MNVIVVFDDGSLADAPLGTILPGITRDSIIALAKRFRRGREGYPSSGGARTPPAASCKRPFACGPADRHFSTIGKVVRRAAFFSSAAARCGHGRQGTRKKLVDISTVARPTAQLDQKGAFLFLTGGAGLRSLTPSPRSSAGERVGVRVYRG